MLGVRRKKLASTKMLSQLKKKKTAAKFKAVKLFGWLRERENEKKNKSWRKLFPLAPLRLNDLHEAQRVQKFYTIYMRQTQNHRRKLAAGKHFNV
jgi:hypothetical protein